MHYDQSWMGFGIVGGLQAGLVSAVAALVFFALFHWLGNRNGWGYGVQISWAFLLTVFITVSGDLVDLFYFTYRHLESMDLLRAKLAEVHDPDSIGLRVLCGLVGTTLGIYVSWLVCHCPLGVRMLRHRPGASSNTAPRD